MLRSVKRNVSYLFYYVVCQLVGNSDLKFHSLKQHVSHLSEGSLNGTSIPVNLVMPDPLCTVVLTFTGIPEGNASGDSVDILYLFPSSSYAKPLKLSTYSFLSFEELLVNVYSNTRSDPSGTAFISPSVKSG